MSGLPEDSKELAAFFSGQASAEERAETWRKIQDPGNPFASLFNRPDQSIISVILASNQLRREDLATRIRAELEQVVEECPTQTNRHIVELTYTRVFAKRRPSDLRRREFFESAGRLLAKLIVERAQSHIKSQTGVRTFDQETRAMGEQSTLGLASTRPDRVLNRAKAHHELLQIDHQIGSIYSLGEFAGRTMEEIAELLGVEIADVEKQFEAAQVEILVTESGNE